MGPCAQTDPTLGWLCITILKFLIVFNKRPYIFLSHWDPPWCWQSSGHCSLPKAVAGASWETLCSLGGIQYLTANGTLAQGLRSLATSRLILTAILWGFTVSISILEIRKLRPSYLPKAKELKGATRFTLNCLAQRLSFSQLSLLGFIHWISIINMRKGAKKTT